MNQNENIGANENIAPWMRTAAFNNYWTYSFVNRSSFYALVSSEYRDFMNRFVQNWLWWYDGWVPYFHSEDKGIPSTRIATALVNKAARKVVGGRVMFKNAGKDSTSTVVNPTLDFVSGKWAQDTDFDIVVNDAVRYAAAAGTALLKLNVSERGKLWAQALRFDSFLPTVGADGEIEDVKCFIRCFTDMNGAAREGGRFESFYVVEHRFFGEYKRITGEVLYNAPLVSYCVHRQSGSITNGQYVQVGEGGAVPFSSLPKAMRKSIGNAFSGIRFDVPSLLPFKDSLGCELVKWSSGVSSLPELPFGESFLSPIISHLMSWDYYSAAANTDMYLGRGRVMLPKPLKNATEGGNFNEGFDSFSFTNYPANPMSDGDNKPVPIQFELRAGDWSEIRNRLIQDISINTGLNISTIASFVNDNTAARTAREISTEENETAEYVNYQRVILEKPINRILKLVTLYHGLPDTVVIRWSAAGLTNRFALAEILQIGLSSGFLSQYKAVQMFNVDDDTQQQQEEYDRIKEEQKRSSFDMNPFEDQNPYDGGIDDDRGEESEGIE